MVFISWKFKKRYRFIFLLSLLSHLTSIIGLSSDNFNQNTEFSIVEKGRFSSGLFPVIICVFEAENENRYIWWWMSLNGIDKSTDSLVPPSVHLPCICFIYLIPDPTNKQLDKHQDNVIYYTVSEIDLLLPKRPNKYDRTLKNGLIFEMRSN